MRQTIRQAVHRTSRQAVHQTIRQTMPRTIRQAVHGRKDSVPRAHLPRLLLLVALAGGTGAACAHHGPGTEGPPPGASGSPGGGPSAGAPSSPGILPPPDAIPGTFTVRQKIDARSKHGRGGFEAVLQKQPGRLTLLGLTPYGSRAFLLEQAAQGGVKLTSYVPRELPFSPDFIIMDIHRVLDDWLGPPPTTDGERTGTIHDERITERWTGGHLANRTFGPPADPAHPSTTITYEGQGPSGLPAKVSLDNARFGYALVITTLPM